MKKTGLVIGAFLSFLFIVWGLVLVYEQHSSTHTDVVFEAIGGIFIAIGLTFFWAVHRSKAS